MSVDKRFGDGGVVQDREERVLQRTPRSCAAGSVQLERPLEHAEVLAPVRPAK